MKRRALFLAIAAATVLALAACAPVASFGRDLLDSGDGATLAFHQATEVDPPGVTFNPDGRPALGVIVVATGTQLVLHTHPPNAVCTSTPELIDCRLGDLTEPATIGMTGRGVLASATYRRPESNNVRQTFAR